MPTRRACLERPQVVQIHGGTPPLRISLPESNIRGGAVDETIAAVRRFNRYYTNVIGALGEGHLDTPFTLTEARVLYELSQHDPGDVVQLRRQLGLDAGYVTRILTRFERDGLITRRRSEADARRLVVSLTRQGRETFATLNRRANRDVSRLITPLTLAERGQLRDSLSTVRTLLDREGRAGEVVLRSPRSGDLGWIVSRNAELYAAEYGWDASYEGLVARIVAEFAASHDPACERAWIADVAGLRAGCVMCVRADDDSAKLRLLLVEPAFRGLGVGRRLVEACVAFARDAGYQRMTLWTQSILTAARRIYADLGFRLIESARHRSFGADLVEETWELDLSG
jgi:DNA-binding MarR family transcriptional regulator/GNAT superfamily N-acetyltransferase